MLRNLLNKKKYFLSLLAILFLYLVITLTIWEKLPNEIYISLRWDGQKGVGFYPKNMQNVKYVFLTPFIGVIVIQVASIFSFANQKDLFSMTFSKVLDLFCSLLIAMGPLSFIVCSLFQNAHLALYFYIIGAIFLGVDTLIFRYKWQMRSER